MRNLLLLSLAACATGPIAVATPSPDATPISTLARPPPPAFDAHAWASAQPTPVECEFEARHLQKASRATAWAALEACVDRPRWLRGQFTQLELILSGAWDDELLKRPEAARLVAHVIALRGGHVEGDLPSVQRLRVPLFSLAAALKQPDVYKGRFVVLRGNLADLRTEHGQTTALLRESALRSATREFETGLKHRSERQATTSAVGDVKTTAFGNLSGTASVNHGARTDESTIDRRFENEKFITGRQALGRLAQPDPFLEPDREFVFLARFDGVRAASDDEDAPSMALVSIVSYYPPNALLLE